MELATQPTQQKSQPDKLACRAATILLTFYRLERLASERAGQSLTHHPAGLIGDNFVRNLASG